jgi:hypothetical protein
MTIDQPIPEGAFFRAAGGIVLPSLLALRAYLRMIPDDEFRTHVAAGKNDFATWVEHTFREQALASKLRASHTREEMVWALDDAFAQLRMERVLHDDPTLTITASHAAGEPARADPQQLQDDAAFRPLTDGITATNERISNGYEEIAKRLQDALKDPMPKEFEREIERLRTRRDELATKISDARKAGKDVLIAALVLRQFPPKLAFAVASREPSDLTLAAKVLDEARRELAEAVAADSKTVKEEVLALASEGTVAPAVTGVRTMGLHATNASATSVSATNAYKPATRSSAQMEVR